MTVAVTTLAPAAALAATRAAMIRALTGAPLGHDLAPEPAASVGPGRLDLVLALEGFPVSGFDALRDRLRRHCGRADPAVTNGCTVR
ncbi:MAG: hypothetical protein P8R54_30520 [Myxococcota bacterium]|nr:hypothetical protein [Myxococcota bacterium]